MQAFSKCREYDDYLKIIYDSMQELKDKIYKENKSAIEKLVRIKDPKIQNKIIKIWKLLDSELSFNGSKSNEMFKKINYLLVIGILQEEYNDYFNKLSIEALYTLIYGEYSSINDKNKDYLPIFLNEELLNSIREDNDKKNKENKANLFGISDYFFMIKEHFKKEPFNTDDKEHISLFQREMINKIKNNELHNGVMNMLEYWNSDEIKELRTKMM